MFDTMVPAYISWSRPELSISVFKLVKWGQTEVKNKF